MADCLESVLASTYPKLEIIVADDASVDDTSHLVKSFASSGVRFIKAGELPGGWLGKNYALQALLTHASGTYIFFMDVDTRVSPTTITQLVNGALNTGVRMVSVIPRREDQLRASVLFSPLRYFWELVFHRATAPATASNAWLVERQALLGLGGFAPVRASVQPESRVAARFASLHEYRVLIGTEALGVQYEKKWRTQLLTSIRLLYPLLGGDAAVSIIIALDLALLASPPVLLIGGLVWGQWWTAGGALVVCGLFAVTYATYTRRLWRHGWWLGAILWPYLVLQELVLVLTSMIQYKRGQVTWKGRRVARARQ